MLASLQRTACTQNTPAHNTAYTSQKAMLTAHDEQIVAAEYSLQHNTAEKYRRCALPVGSQGDDARTEQVCAPCTDAAAVLEHGGHLGEDDIGLRPRGCLIGKQLLARPAMAYQRAQQKLRLALLAPQPRNHLRAYDIASSEPLNSSHVVGICWV